MAGTPSDYHRGEMQIAEQVSTFHLVMGLTKWGSLVIGTLILFITLLFCTGTGFIGAALAAAVLLALGVTFLRARPAAAH